MLKNIVVGPPMVGATDLKSLPEKLADKDFKGSGSDSSFGKTLEDKMSSARESKELKESPRKELRQSKSKEEEKPQKNSEAKETDKKVAKPEGKVSKKTAARQQIIKEFMDSFESEFEIPPTRIVEAMAQLDDAELVQSPEVTADAVIDQLGLEDDEADAARAMYAAFLMQLNQTPQQPQAKPVQEIAIGSGVSRQNMQERVLAAQDKQNFMSNSVDLLNKKFRETKSSVETMPSLNQALSQNMMLDEDSLSESILQDSMADLSGEEIPLQASEGENPAIPPMTDAKAQLPELPPHLQGQMKETISPALLAALVAKQAAANNLAGTDAEEEASALKEEFQQALQVPKVEKPAMAMVQPTPEQGKFSQEFFQNQNSASGQSWMQQNSKEFIPQKAGGKEEVLTKLTEKSASFKNALTGLESIQATPLKGETLGMEAALPAVGAAAPAANPGENEAAVKQLMNQAQYLIKKGGGEMKVQMTPEGMGTIHLKVMLQDGKVNMQMSADTQEAKKTIESSLAELKTSLAAHKLSMENVKVDVVNSTSTDTATQNQTNMNGQNQRDQARQFWNQFNENFGSHGRRESFTEMPNLKGYGQRNRDPLQPIESASTARTRSVEGKGSGLNLVA